MRFFPEMPQVETFILPGPGLAKELQAGRDAGLVGEAVDSHPVRQVLEAVDVHEFRQERLQRDSVKRIPGLFIRHGDGVSRPDRARPR